MGIEIHKSSFAPNEYEAFSRRLRKSLEALETVLQRPRFGAGPKSLGAELELFLIGPQGEPVPLNRSVLAESLHDKLTVELSRFNLELNLHPEKLSGQPFGCMAKQMQESLAITEAAAAKFGARITTIGILPTLKEHHLKSWALTDFPRYRALAAATRRERGGEIRVRIDGDDSFDLEFDDVTIEGANTSFQVHLRIDPSEFAAAYNAAQLATGPALAFSGNSPMLIEHFLWEETRIALFRQAIDDRPGGEAEAWRPARVSFGHGWVREGIYELFAEAVGLHRPMLPVLSDEDPLDIARAGGVPKLAELRLHQGTVWRCNRAIYDDADGGHIRIEFRALPAGPIVVDMTANAAFLVGLTLALMPRMKKLMSGITFGHARRNFYEAARHGLSAELLWPTEDGSSPELYPAKTLLTTLIPLAGEGLIRHGVEPSEVESLLTVISARVANGLTGSRWQRRMVEAFEAHTNRAGASAEMLECYLRHSRLNQPVHEWPLR